MTESEFREQSGAEGLFMGLLFAAVIFVAGMLTGVGLSVAVVMFVTEWGK